VIIRKNRIEKKEYKKEETPLGKSPNENRK